MGNQQSGSWVQAPLDSLFLFLGSTLPPPGFSWSNIQGGARTVKTTPGCPLRTSKRRLPWYPLGSFGGCRCKLVRHRSHRQFDQVTVIRAMFKGLFARGGKADVPAGTASLSSGRTGNMGRNIQRSFARGVDCNSKRGARPLTHRRSGVPKRAPTDTTDHGTPDTPTLHTTPRLEAEHRHHTCPATVLWRRRAG